MLFYYKSLHLSGECRIFAAAIVPYNNEIAAKMRGVAEVERHHEERYMKLLKNIEEGIVFSREGDTIWKCRNCGHIVVGKKAPEICPVCAHPQSYFEINAQNY